MATKKQTFIVKAKAVSASLLKELFVFETPYQIDRMSAQLKELSGKYVKILIGKTSRPKTEEALGMYFGAIVPATAMDMLNLSYDPANLYEDYRLYKQRGLIGQKQLDGADDMLRIAFHYRITRTIKGGLYRIPKELKTQDNGPLLELIDKCMQWRSENQYPFIDIEIYKQGLNSAKTK